MAFKIFTVGWEPYFIDEFLSPISKQTGFQFLHGLVGDAARIAAVKKHYPDLNFFALSKNNKDLLPEPDINLLKKLESVGVPTIRSMIQGDRVLKYRNENESLGYATLLAKNLSAALEEYRPDVVLASYDSMHASMSLAVAKLLNIPWVALAFTVIPDNLTGFCNALTPNSLVPIVSVVDDQIRSTATMLMQSVRLKNQTVVAYRAPYSVSQWIKQYFMHVKHLARRKLAVKFLGIDRFTYPTNIERIFDIVRRTINRFSLPKNRMLRTTPEDRFIYYPLHMSPESMVDTWAPFYQNQLAFIKQLALAMPIDTVLAVKLHFSDPDNYSRQQLMQLIKMPRVRIVHPNASGSDFIKKASLVIGITGTSCLEAALLGKPVLIFGDSPYAHFPRSERAKTPYEWYGQISRMLAQPAPEDTEIEKAYAAYLARYMPGRINDWSHSIEADELVRYVECFKVLANYLAEPLNRTNWYNQPPFVSNNKLD